MSISSIHIYIYIYNQYILLYECPLVPFHHILHIQISGEKVVSENPAMKFSKALLSAVLRFCARCSGDGFVDSHGLQTKQHPQNRPYLKGTTHACASFYCFF